MTTDHKSGRSRAIRVRKIDESLTQNSLLSNGTDSPIKRVILKAKKDQRSIRLKAKKTKPRGKQREKLAKRIKAKMKTLEHTIRRRALSDQK